jgi:hypothetical protein
LDVFGGGCFSTTKGVNCVSFHQHPKFLMFVSNGCWIKDGNSGCYTTLSSRMVIRAGVAGFPYPHCSKAIKVLTLMAFGHPKNEKKAIFCFLSELRVEMHGQNGALNWQGSPMFYHWMICRTRMARRQSVHNIPNGNYFYQQVVAKVYA